MKVQLRDPNTIMKLSRLGSFHQSKLSFLRSFLNEFKDWEYKRDLFNLDKFGYGEAVYSFRKDKRTYSLVCFANEIKDNERSDRVIATKWDAAFTLHDGVPTQKDIDRLKNEVPKQEVGRLSFKELTLSRANKSVRVFNHVVEKLSEGKQPDLELLSKVGYLYRTTAVYGSGKFGLADRFRIKNREEINGPFRLEMMLVYLVRQFTFDQVNHVAHHKNPSKAVKLDKKICKNLGIGNSTGLGMAPFIVNHPTLLNNWVLSREIALKKIREIKTVKKKESDLFVDCIKKSLTNITSWNTDSEYQQIKIKNLLKDIKKFIKFIDKFFDLEDEYPFNKIYLWLENEVCEECIEYVVSIMMEPYNEITTPLTAQMSSEEDKYFTIPSSRSLKELRNIIEKKYSNILKINFDKKKNTQNFWFISKNKEEPRLADRFEESGSELEQPLAIARDVKKLYEKLLNTTNISTVAEFLSKNSELRHIIRRVFIVEKFPYSEIQDNTIGKNIMPIDMLRLKLSFFGALKFDPRSDKWLRICMFQGAPLPDELKNYDEQWVYRTSI
ncbi:MAG: hypothetical protein CNB21_00080 [Pelagibacterales bacterium MED-G39]|nr:MAG: hypothetical protein CNB21_00080 [Pelagibacterales bacterium MED-G39]